MTNELLKQAIIKASQEIGIDKIGFTTADNFEHLRPSLVAQKAAGHTTGFEHQNLDERLNPDQIFVQPESNNVPLEPKIFVVNLLAPLGGLTITVF